VDNRTYYLKYRPQKISELDLTAVRESLTKVLKSKKIPHALLFSGPRGIGKTSAARIFAKAINCPTKRKTFEPCNRCKICQGITEGSVLDLIEIDAASNRGIDDVRDLRDKIKLAPAECRYKVYIIDEVHMLTHEAFNALLKTLEEPPEHAVFILCTTAPEKLPETILSRCLRFNFKKATVAEVIRSLERVVKGEKLKIEKGVLPEIANAVDGSFRDGQKILDQLAMGKKKISLKETQELLGKIEAMAPGKLLTLLAERKLKAALLEINRVVCLGADLSQYCQEILEKFRLGLLAKAGLTEISSPEVMVGFSLAELTDLIRLFSQAAKDLKTSPIPQLPLEMAVVAWLGSEKEKKRRRDKD
jgi:DNA polymerase-3 subunit gamma/tau